MDWKVAPIQREKKKLRPCLGYRSLFTPPSMSLLCKFSRGSHILTRKSKQSPLCYLVPILSNRIILLIRFKISIITISLIMWKERNTNGWWCSAKNQFLSKYVQVSKWDWPQSSVLFPFLEYLFGKRRQIGF